MDDFCRTTTKLKACIHFNSWHEIGVYDIPAIIDHILNTTNQKKLNYIGHSQGTTSFFVLASMRPEYNEKLLDVHLLAPVANLNNTRNQVNVVFSRFYTPLKVIFDALGIYRFTVSNSMVSKVFEYACKDRQDSTPFTCKLGLAIFGSTQINCVSYTFFDYIFLIPTKKEILLCQSRSIAIIFVDIISDKFAGHFSIHAGWFIFGTNVSLHSIEKNFFFQR